jgi:hypothetical protein
VRKENLALALWDSNLTISVAQKGAEVVPLDDASLDIFERSKALRIRLSTAKDKSERRLWTSSGRTLRLNAV